MKNHRIFRAVIGLFCLSTLLSCRSLNSNRILFYDKESKTTFDTLPPVTHAQKIVPGDRLTIRFYPNEGEALLLAKTSSSEENVSSNNTQEYEVNSRGVINFPLIGEFEVNRKTCQEVQELLQVELSKKIKKPFVVVEISNQRVILFCGSNDGKSLPLKNNNTSILEVIAMGGGLKEKAKSKEVHLLRTIDGKRHVYQLDLSNIDKISVGEILVQNHDIIVVNYHPRKLQTALKEVTPWLNLFSIGFTVFNIVLRY